MTISGYEKDKVRAFLANALEDTPQGTQAAIARAAGVSGTAVNRWRWGWDCPSPRHWPIIEEVLGLKPGSIAKAGNIAASAVTREARSEEIRRIRDQMEQLQARLEALDQQRASQR